jgi:hypothetical protein
MNNKSVYQHKRTVQITNIPLIERTVPSFTTVLTRWSVNLLGEFTLDSIEIVLPQSVPSVSLAVLFGRCRGLQEMNMSCESAFRRDRNRLETVNRNRPSYPYKKTRDRNLPNSLPCVTHGLNAQVHETAPRFQIKSKFVQGFTSHRHDGHI